MDGVQSLSRFVYVCNSDLKVFLGHFDHDKGKIPTPLDPGFSATMKEFQCSDYFL